MGNPGSVHRQVPFFGRGRPGGTPPSSTGRSKSWGSLPRESKWLAFLRDGVSVARGGGGGGGGGGGSSSRIHGRG
eukprot:8714962-Alexandrium_andersonii.AAC.1